MWFTYDQRAPSSAPSAADAAAGGWPAGASQVPRAQLFTSAYTREHPHTQRDYSATRRPATSTATGPRRARLPGASLALCQLSLSCSPRPALSPSPLSTLRSLFCAHSSVYIWPSARRHTTLHFAETARAGSAILLPLRASLQLLFFLACRVALYRAQLLLAAFARRLSFAGRAHAPRAAEYSIKRALLLLLCVCVITARPSCRRSRRGRTPRASGGGRTTAGRG